MKITELFSDRQFYKNLFVIALPIMLQSFFSSAVNMVDTIMLGRLGTVEIAGVGLANQIFFLYNMVLFGLCSGTSIFTAQFWGKRDLAGIRHNMGFSLIISLGAAALFVAFAFFAPETLIGIYSRDPLVIAAGAEYLHIACLSYIPLGISTVIVFTLRSVEKVRLPMVTTIIALSFNSLSNYFLIFGNGPFPALGVKGAAVTTIIARTIELVLLISFSNIKKYPIICRLSELLGFHLPYVRRFFRIVLPVLANEMIWSFGVSMQNLIFARTHTDAYAAFNITGTVNMLTWVIFLGLGNGVAVLIGKKIGEGNETAARDYATRISLFAPLLAVGMAFVLMGISLFIPFVFNVNQNVIAMARIMFLMIAIMYPLRAYNMTMVVGICRAGGDTVFCVLYDVGFMWALSLPLAAAAALFLKAPVWAIFMCICSEDLLKAGLGIWRLRTGKWLHNVTGGI